ncbi:MAG: ketoacyl-ACP synthase III [Pirellulales bacterium]|nr:ketoacyl-ACP synthase III [Pirellulales bacterium]
MSNPPQNSPEREIRTSQSRTGRLTGIQIVGTGSGVPANVIRNEDLASLGYDADWIIQRTGIRQRRHAPPETATSDMAVDAARQAIDQAGVDPADIDLVLLGTFTPDLLAPSTACLVQDRLGLRAPAMDVHAACAGYVYAMITGMQFVATGCSRLALVIGADCNSRILDPSDKKTYPLFGDGAGATLIAPGNDDQGLLAYALGSDGSGADLFYRRMGGTRMPLTPEGIRDGLQFVEMAGRPIFKWAVRIVDETVRQVVDQAGKTLDDVDLFIFHQANIRIINSAVNSLGISPDKVFNNLEEYGNTSAGTIPLALDQAHRAGRVKPGDLIVFSGFGAGLTWGTTLLRW